jgi:proline dehydrogenase
VAVMRSFFLACSQSQWMRERAGKYGFMRRAVSRFMPGETLSDAVEAALDLERQSIGTVFTHLGENIADEKEAADVTAHYLEVLERVRAAGLRTEVSVKLTQLGLDLNSDLCYQNLAKIIEHAGPSSVVWIDMEASNYLDATLDIFRRARAAHPNVGVCVQAYLYRTKDDIEDLIRRGAAIRLVKGAYKELPSVAFPAKADVDRNYFTLAQRLLSDEARSCGVRAALATHDVYLIQRIIEYAEAKKLSKSSLEFQMLYGIQRQHQLLLAHDGWKSAVLIAYGSFWFPWYMRRLAERPANVFFVLRNLFAG